MHVLHVGVAAVAIADVAVQAATEEVAEILMQVSEVATGEIVSIRSCRLGMHGRCSQLLAGSVISGQVGM